MNCIVDMQTAKQDAFLMRYIIFLIVLYVVNYYAGQVYV